MTDRYNTQSRPRVRALPLGVQDPFTYGFNLYRRRCPSQSGESPVSKHRRKYSML
jgi:hypothetical protein